MDINVKRTSIYWAMACISAALAGCIVDGITGDGGMPRDQTAATACNTTLALDPNSPAACGAPYKGAILVLGDSGTKVASQWSVKRLSIESKRKQTFRFE
jgi:hypothetical protein